MKKQVFVCTLALICCAIIFSGCSWNATVQDENTNQNNDVAQIENTGYGKMGFAVDTKDGAYYWKFTGDDLEEGALFANFGYSENASVELIGFDGENESVIAETAVASEFVVTDKFVFFEDKDSINAVSLADGEKKIVANGRIDGITEDGKFLIFSSYDENYIKITYSFNTDTSEIFRLVSATDVVAIHNGIVYHTPREEDFEAARHGLISLYAAKPDASENRLLFTSDGRIYNEEEYYFSDGPVGIAQIRFGDEYIYFSYGGSAGTGHFYSGGNIVRIKYDGSGAETLYSCADGNYIDSEFAVNPDGSVTAIYVMENDGVYNYLDKYIQRDGCILWFDDVTGMPTNICSYYPDENYDLSTADFVNVTDKYAFFVTHYCTYVPEKNIGWRDYYKREKSIFYMIDRQTGEIVTSYEF